VINKWQLIKKVLLKKGWSLTGTLWIKNVYGYIHSSTQMLPFFLKKRFSGFLATENMCLLINLSVGSLPCSKGR